MSHNEATSDGKYKEKKEVRRRTEGLFGNGGIEEERKVGRGGSRTQKSQRWRMNEEEEKERKKERRRSK